jgi:NADPH-dependent 2,4-dienoyl-CoA reductase/sulfur reductase-like enzyme
MPENVFTYIIVGGGLAGASAIEGIREQDAAGTLLLIGDEKHLPYDRPPLSKKLWLGKKRVDEIFLHDAAFYRANHVELKLGVTVTRLDPFRKTVADDSGNEYHYGKLLLATGGRPRPLPVPGGELDGICYFRYLDDYEKVRAKAAPGRSVLVVGGGFIGSEMAAALCVNGLAVTMIFPEDSLCQLVFPPALSLAMRNYFLDKGIVILNGDKPVAISKRGEGFVTRTEKGREIGSDIVIVGIGIQPEVKLASSAGLKIENGIVVNEYLQTSYPGIYAAGDNAYFPCKALGKKMRAEHWDNALNQGKYAGRNMAGSVQPYDYLAYFFSDLFEFGYEAVGEVSSKLTVFADWQEENRKGVVYYLDRNKVRGVMLCDVWGQVDAARQLILKSEDVTEAGLRGAIR